MTDLIGAQIPADSLGKKLEGIQAPKERISS
jgi:hypothetical protein